MMIHGLPVALLVRIAVRNLLAHKVKSIIVAAIIILGTTLVVVGNSLVESVNAAMAESITSSLAGHIQLQDADAEDQIALFGGEMMGADDIGVIEDFSKVKRGLAGVDDIAAIVPMGMDSSITYGGNYIDRTLERLRAAVNAGDAGRVAALKAHARRIVAVLTEELKNLAVIASEDVLQGEEVQELQRANEEDFWRGFDADPLAALEYLENKVAPLALDAQMVFLRYLGTDVTAFGRTFERFHIVQGEMVPSGRRGFLFNKFVYEEQIKHRTARRLDLVKEARAEGRTLATDAELQQMIDFNVAQYKEIVLQIDPTDAPAVIAALRQALGAAAPAPAPAPGAADPNGGDPNGGELTALVKTFLAMTDANFDKRYAEFYEIIAPRVMLYQIPVGSVLTLTAFTESGYTKSVNVPVYGVFEFKGIDKSAIAGIHNVMDLMTFRDLYGYRTAADREEITALKAGSGIEDLTAEQAEAALFGGDDAAPLVEERPAAKGFDEFAGVDLAARERYDEELFRRTYTQDELDGGVVLSAAVVLKDPSRLEAVMERIREVSEADGLGIRPVDWQSAAGLVGQFITVIRIVLYVAILIIFTVAIVIINNSMVMATMERVREIGTLRAIGAQRGLVRWMLFIETGVLASAFGLVGIVVGSAVVLALGSVGIAAPNDILEFLFGGPRLYPFLAPAHLLAAFVIMLFVSAASTFYPAFIATRITPLEAMQKSEE